MGLVFFVTLCLLSFYSAITSGDRRSRVVFMFIFWGSFALVILRRDQRRLFMFYCLWVYILRSGGNGV